MADFAFVGDPNDKYSGPNFITVKGVEFVKNTATKVPANLEAFFASHSHFCTKADLPKMLAKQQSATKQPKKAKVVEEPTEKYAGATIADLRELIEAREGKYNGDEDDVGLKAILEEMDNA